MHTGTDTRTFPNTMLSLTRLSRARLPLAQFNMKHFQCKQKHDITPDNFQRVFTTAILPRDRLLRQSSAGGGATRVLVLDNMQQVKGVYFPMLCLPYPTTVKGGDSALGITVGNYLDIITPKAPAEMPTTLVLMSHPYGVAIASYASDGSVHMPVKNITAPVNLVEQQQEEGQPPVAQDEDATLPDAAVPSPLSTPEYISTIMAAIAEEHNKYLANCSTFFFVTRDKTASLTLGELRKEEDRLVKESGDDAAQCAIPFSDHRWIALPDSMMQANRNVPLYTRDKKTGERIVSQKGLDSAVTHGRMELDVWATRQKPGTAPDAEEPASG